MVMAGVNVLVEVGFVALAARLTAGKLGAPGNELTGGRAGR